MNVFYSRKSSSQNFLSLVGPHLDKKIRIRFFAELITAPPPPWRWIKSFFYSKLKTKLKKSVRNQKINKKTEKKFPSFSVRIICVIIKMKLLMCFFRDFSVIHILSFKILALIFSQNLLFPTNFHPVHKAHLSGISCLNSYLCF